jgi:hypothetical protein
MRRAHFQRFGPPAQGDNMAKTPVIRVQCSRCEREEFREVTADIKKIEQGKAFVAKLIVEDGERDVVFDDLCKPCTRTITKLLEQIGKKIDGKAPDRAGK